MTTLHRILLRLLIGLAIISTSSIAIGENITAPSPPVITSTEITSATEDIPYNYALTGSDVNVDDELTWTAPTKPDWLSLNEGGLSVQTLHSNITTVNNTAIDSNDNIYTVKFRRDKVYRITPEGVESEFAVVDSALKVGLEVLGGYLYIAYFNEITRLDLSNPSAGETSVVTDIPSISSLNSKDGNLFVSQDSLGPSNPAIYQVDVSTQQSSVFALRTSGATAFGFDSNGDLYEGNRFGGLYKFVNDAFEAVDSPSSAQITAIEPRNQGGFYLRTLSEIYIIYSDGSTSPAISSQTGFAMMTNANSGILLDNLIDVSIDKLVPGGPTLSGTPTNNDVGIHPVIIALSDGSSSVTQNFNIVVSNTNDSPTGMTLSNNTIGQTSAISTVGSFSTADIDPGPDSFIYTLVNNGSAGLGSCGVDGDAANTFFTINDNTLDTKVLLEPNSYNICVQTSDGASTYEQTFEVIISDAIAPIVSLEQPAVAISNNANPRIEISTTELGTIQVGGSCGSSNEGQTASVGNNTISITQPDNSSSLTDGLYSNCSLTITDAANNVSNALSLGSFIIDTVATIQGIKFDQTTVNASNNTAISFTLLGAETGGQLTYKIKSSAGGPEFRPFSGIAVTSASQQFNGLDLSLLTEGTLTIEASLTDGLGNTSRVVTDSISKVDNSAPTLSGVPTTVIEQDVFYSFTPTLIDPDANDTHTFSITNKPSWATFNPSTGTLSGTPSREDVGTTNSIVITVTDDKLSDSLGAFSIEVLYVNEAPFANNANIEVDEDSMLSFTLDAGDNDIEDILTTKLISPPMFGTLTGDGVKWTYESDTDYNGTDSFTYLINDGIEDSPEATISISVKPINDEPIANPDRFVLSTNESNIYMLDVLANDIDVDEEVLTITSAKASVGMVTAVQGKLQFTSDASIQGNVELTYRVEDTAGASSQSIATLRFDNVKDNAPTIELPSSVEVNATGLFTKVDLGVPIATDTNGNQIAVSLVDNNLYFAPGKHTVYWQATGSNGERIVAAQELAVHPLISLSKDKKTPEDNLTKFSVFLNGPAPSYPVAVPFSVSGNADGIDHDLINGEVTINEGTQASVEFLVFADSETEGSEMIVIALDGEINMGAKNSTTITITEDNIAPVVSIDVRQSEQSRTLVEASDALVSIIANVSDMNVDDSVELAWSSTDGTIANLGASSDEFVFSTADLANGIYTFNVTARDNGAPSLSVNEVIYIDVVDTLPALSMQDSDGDLIPDISEGYGDADSDGIPDYIDANSQCNVLPEQVDNPQQYLLEGEPGVCIRKGVLVGQNSTGGAQLLSSELVSDDAAINTGGIFDFVARGLPNAGDSYRIVIPQRLSIPSNAVYRKLIDGVWVNFAIDDKNKVYSAQGEPGFCPPPSDIQWTTGLTLGHWCVQLEIEDGGPNDDDGLANRNVVDPGGVSVLLSDNTLPLVNNDAVNLGAGERITLDVVANDSDADGDALTLSALSVDFGNASIMNNQIDYSPPLNFVGIATIQYSITDGQGGSASGQAIVNVIVNAAPSAVNDSASTNDRQAITIDVLANDTDDNGDVLTVTAASAQQGQVTILQDGALNYSPKLGFEGNDIITYTVKDANQASATAVVTVSIVTVKEVVIDNTASGGSTSGIVLFFLAFVVLLRSIKGKLSAALYICVLSCLVVSNTQAQDGNWSTEFSIGQATSSNALPDVDGDISSLQVDTKSTSVSAGLYYQVADQWDIGLRYIDLGETKVKLRADTTDPLALRLKYAQYAPITANGVGFQGGYSFALADKFGANVFVGGFWHRYKTISQLSFEDSILEQTQTDLSFYIGSRLSYSITTNIDFSAQYTHFTLVKNDVNDVSVSLRWRF